MIRDPDRIGNQVVKTNRRSIRIADLVPQPDSNNCADYAADKSGKREIARSPKAGNEACRGRPDGHADPDKRLGVHPRFLSGMTKET